MAATASTTTRVLNASRPSDYIHTTRFESRLHLHLPQDLLIEILSYLNIRDSNSLAHVNHEWLCASRIERRRLVEVTDEMAIKLTAHSRSTKHSVTLSTITRSPIARLITQLPHEGPYQFDRWQRIITAAIYFPNLLSMHMYVRQSAAPLPKSLSRKSTGQSFTPTFQLPSRLKEITIGTTSTLTPTSERQQFYLDSLSTADQLQMVEFAQLDPDLNLTVLTFLPHLTDLIIHPRLPTERQMKRPPKANVAGNPPPAHVWQVVNSLKQLISLRIGWTIQPDQWSQLQLPLLQYISHRNGWGVNCSTDLMPLMDTVMVKSIRHLRLQLDRGCDLSQLMELGKFTQLDRLEIFRDLDDQNGHPLTDGDIRAIHLALSRLVWLTSLKIHRISSKRENKFKINVSDVLAASPHLSTLILTDHFSLVDSNSSSIDFNFLRTPLAHGRLRDLTMGFDSVTIDMISGVLQCCNLRRLHISSLSRTSTSTSPSHSAPADLTDDDGKGGVVNDWYDWLQVKLDSRDVLPSLEDLLLKRYVSRLRWSIGTGSETHTEFRLFRSSV